MTIRHVVTAFVLAVCTLAAVLSNSAQADNIGGTCVPDSATVRAGVYETAGFGIRFAGNATGKIRPLCLLEDTDLAGEELEPVIWLSVIDQDGMDGSARTCSFSSCRIRNQCVDCNGDVRFQYLECHRSAPAQLPNTGL
jgi:hypothetical protein